MQEKHDSLARLGECFVRLQVDKITEANEECSRDDLRRYVYNPNEITSIADMNLFNLFKPLADIVIANNTHRTKKCRDVGQTIRNRYRNIFCEINPITRKRFNDILLKNSMRHDTGMDNRKTTDPHFLEIENVINAVCHPTSVANACEVYIEQVKNEIK